MLFKNFIYSTIDHAVVNFPLHLHHTWKYQMPHGTITFLFIHKLKRMIFWKLSSSDLSVALITSWLLPNNVSRKSLQPLKGSLWARQKQNWPTFFNHHSLHNIVEKHDGNKKNGLSKFGAHSHPIATRSGSPMCSSLHPTVVIIKNNKLWKIMLKAISPSFRIYWWTQPTHSRLWLERGSISFDWRYTEFGQQGSDKIWSNFKNGQRYILDDNKLAFKRSSCNHKNRLE